MTTSLTELRAAYEAAILDYENCASRWRDVGRNPQAKTIKAELDSARERMEQARIEWEKSDKAQRLNDRNGSGTMVVSVETIRSQETIIADLTKQRDALLAAVESFLRAPSIGSNRMGSISIEVTDFNLKAARIAIEKAGAK